MTTDDRPVGWHQTLSFHSLLFPTRGCALQNRLSGPSSTVSFLVLLHIIME